MASPRGLASPTQPISTTPFAIFSILAPGKIEVGNKAEPAGEQNIVMPTPAPCSCMMPVGQAKLGPVVKEREVQAWGYCGWVFHWLWGRSCTSLHLLFLSYPVSCLVNCHCFGGRTVLCTIPAPTMRSTGTAALLTTHQMAEFPSKDNDLFMLVPLKVHIF